MYNQGNGIRLRSSARTSTGQVRENNEDNVHLLARDLFVLAIVADGMGGAAAGEEASRIAVDTINSGILASDYHDYQKFQSMDEGVITEMVRDSIRTANLNIVQRAINYPALKGMGTTLTMAIIRETSVVIAHVGDSRAYLIDAEERDITQVTADHSFVEALVAAGHITREEAEDHPMRNVLYRALGQADDLDIDVYYKRLNVGDRLVLCSDGLTRHVKPDEIRDIVLEEEDPAVSSQKLIDLANLRGGEDNITVVVITVERDPTKTSQTEVNITNENDDDTLLLNDRSFRRSLAEPALHEEDTAQGPPVKDEASLNVRTTVKHQVVEIPVPEKLATSEVKGTEGEGRDPRVPEE